MANLFIRISAIYLVAGACLGMFMGITMNFTLIPVHAHILLAGWLSLAVMGLIYHAHPQSARTRLAKWHCWLHNLGLPVFMASLALAVNGHPIPVALATGSIALLAGLILFALNVWLAVGRGP